MHPIKLSRKINFVVRYAYMRLLGIDYGTKRIGLSLSDETGEFALPYQVIENNSQAIKMIIELCRTNAVTEVVLGESTNYDGSDNVVMVAIRDFAQELEKQGAVSVIFEPEFFSSQQAKRDIGKDELYDARAAAIILQSYLDKKRYARMA
jgi:putative Holliday junction resolvase